MVDGEAEFLVILVIIIVVQAVASIMQPDMVGVIMMIAIIGHLLNVLIALLIRERGS